MVRCCTDIIWAYKQDGFCLQLSVWGWKPTSNLVCFLRLVLINKWNKIWNLHSYLLDLRVSFGVHTLSHCQDELLADSKCLSLSLLIEAMVLICTQVHLDMPIQLVSLHKDHWAHEDIKEFFSIDDVKCCCAFHCTMHSQSFHIPFLWEKRAGKAALVAALPRAKGLCPNS